MKSLRALFAISSMLVLSASALNAQGTTVTCKDGAKSAGGQGACSGHGGIATKATIKADAKAAKAEAKADAKIAKSEVKKDGKVVAAAMKNSKSEMKADAKIAKGKVEAKESKAEAKAEAKVAKADAKMDAKMAMDDKDAKGAIAICKDKTYSHAKNHQGACSTHGGVAKFLDGK